MTRNDADGYFAYGKHAAAAIWNKFSSEYRDESFETAKRQIQVFLSADELPDQTNVKYALFEQALHVAKYSGSALDFDRNRPAFIPPDGGASANEDSGNPNVICDTAKAFISGLGGTGKARRPSIVIARA